MKPTGVVGYGTNETFQGQQWGSFPEGQGNGGGNSSGNGPPPAIASWSANGPRIFALDATAGDDGQRGFVDANSFSVADIKAATTAAGVVALKTVAALAAIFPRQGAGKSAIVVVNTYNGTVTYNGLYGILTGCEGYARGCPLIRGTSTQTTAGCVAFDGTPADILYWGAAIAAGTNAPGYNPTGTPTTTQIQMLKVGGGAAGLTPESAGNAPIPIGLRIRFDNSPGTATQAALQNVCRRVIQVVGTDTVDLNTALPVAPVSTDKFYFEDGGIVTDNVALQTANGAALQAVQVVGVRATGSLSGPYTQALLAFCHVANFAPGAGFSTWFSSNGTTPFYPDGTFPVVGGGLRVDTSGNFELGAVDISGVVFAGATTPTARDCNRCSFRAGAVSAGGYTAADSRAQMDTSNVTFGAGTGEASSRIIGPGASAGLDLRWWNGTIANLSITNMGAVPCILLRDICRIVLGGPFAASGVTGSAGNTDVGLDLTNARGSLIVIEGVALPGITGTVGDVRLASGQITSWAAISDAGGLVDSAGNTFVVGTPAASPVLPALNSPAAQLCVSAKVDLTATGVSQITPSFPGYYALVFRTGFILTDLTGIPTSGPTTSFGNNGTHNNYGTAAAMSTTSVAGPPPTLGAGPTFNVAAPALIDMATPISVNITIAVGGAPAVCKGRFMIWLALIPISSI